MHSIFVNRIKIFETPGPETFFIEMTKIEIVCNVYFFAKVMVHFLLLNWRTVNVANDKYTGFPTVAVG